MSTRRSPRHAMGCFLATVFLAGLLAGGRPLAQSSADVEALDQVLDLYVRDGFVYYRALRQDRSRLDRFVRSIATASIEGAAREAQLSFWLNAYNALVLRTVIDRYPIPQRTREYPPGSIRQIPGAFERQPHRVAGRMLTLDDIERTVLPPFGDPRVFFALGRGAAGSGRLRSEAYTAAALEGQLADVARECARRSQCLQIDRSTDRVLASAIFSWREREFTDYAGRAPEVFGSRSPIERAILAFVWSDLLAAERESAAENRFELRFMPFDWSLNDLGSRG